MKLIGVFSCDTGSRSTSRSEHFWDFYEVALRRYRRVLLRVVGGSTGLLGEAPGGVRRGFSGAGINVEHEKKVDLGVLRGADHDGRVLVSPFSTVDGVCFDGVSSSR